MFTCSSAAFQKQLQSLFQHAEVEWTYKSGVHGHPCTLIFAFISHYRLTKCITSSKGQWLGYPTSIQLFAFIMHLVCRQASRPPLVSVIWGGHLMATLPVEGWRVDSFSSVEVRAQLLEAARVVSGCRLLGLESQFHTRRRQNSHKSLAALSLR